MKKEKLMLIILDGYGIAPDSVDNAVKNGTNKDFLELVKNASYTELEASGKFVGLPDGQMGNSEVGHLHIGAGRIIPQDLELINRSVQTGEIFENEFLKKAFSEIKEKGTALNLIGLLSDGGVHSDINHLFCLLDLAKKFKLEKVNIHVITDGRDTPTDSGIRYVKMLENKIKEIGTGRIVSVSGRYYAMDREKNWDRTAKYLDCILSHNSDFPAYMDSVEAVLDAYSKGETDEFIKPRFIELCPTVRDNDTVMFFNFRADRMRQIVKKFIQLNENGKSFKLFSFTQYDEEFTSVKVIFQTANLDYTLGEILSRNGYTQLRLAESTKYAHVTYFFNGGNEKSYDNENRILVPMSEVATFDLAPEMKSAEIAVKALQNLKENKSDFILINFANPDMVGHTGIYEAAAKAVNAATKAAKIVAEEALKNGYNVIITADHGNAEKMTENRSPFTAHTTSKVPFYLFLNSGKKVNLKTGGLANIAPTVLEILGINKPEIMTEESLIR